MMANLEYDAENASNQVPVIICGDHMPGMEGIKEETNETWLRAETIKFIVKVGMLHTFDLTVVAKTITIIYGSGKGPCWRFLLKWFAVTTDSLCKN